MRYLAVVTLMLVSVLPTAAVQTRQSEMWVTIQPTGIAGGRASLHVQNAEIYVDGGFVGVGIPGQEKNPAAALFTVRAWKEASKARVVVYASLKDDRAPAGTTETPIATFAITAGESVEVPQAEKWGGKRLTVQAELR